MHLLNQARYTGLVLAVATLGLGSLMWPATSTAEAEPRGPALGVPVTSTADPRWCASPHEDERPGTAEEVSLAGDNPESDGSAHPEQCFWSGTAPFCEGACPVGFTTVAMDRCGDGNCCVTGWKVYCCPG